MLTKEQIDEIAALFNDHNRWPSREQFDELFLTAHHGVALQQVHGGLEALTLAIMNGPANLRFHEYFQRDEAAQLIQSWHLSQIPVVTEDAREFLDALDARIGEILDDDKPGRDRTDELVAMIAAHDTKLREACKLTWRWEGDEIYIGKRLIAKIARDSKFNTRWRLGSRSFETREMAQLAAQEFIASLSAEVPGEK